MNNTPNYGYNLPEYLEDADVVILNQNFTAIDKDILDVRQIAVLMYDPDERYDTDALVGFENPTDHHIRMFRCLEDNVTGVWDSTKWTNTNVAAELLRRSGGGTEVEANPSGSATDYLTKVKIGNTIYAVTPADMTGATSQDAGAHGLVPAPSAGDESKVLYGDGTWKTPQSAPSNLGDLGDVTLTTPTEGQILTYDGDEWVNADAPDVDVTKTASGNPIEISDGANAPLVKCVTQITGYQSGTGTPSPSNIRPIVAYTEGEIEVRGKNIFDYTQGQNISVFQSGTTMRFSPSDARIVACGGKVKNGEAYTFSFPSGVKIATMFYYENGTLPLNQGSGSIVGTIISVENASGVYTFTATETNYIYFYFAPTQGQTTLPISTLSTAQMEKGTTPTTYEPYTSTTHTTTYPSAIYQGSEDVVKGEVTSEYGFVDEDDFTYVSSSESPGGLRFAECLTSGDAKAKLNGIGLCNMAPQNNSGAWTSTTPCFQIHTTTEGQIRIFGTFTTLAEFKTQYAGLQLYYELATPTTTPVTPTNLPIRTLSGYNHIESSTGEMEIEYITGKYQPIVDLIQSSKHVYSTAEQVVGTWIDGSTLYEKTIEVQNFTASTFDSRISTYSGVLDLSTYISSLNHIFPIIEKTYIVLQDTTIRIPLFIDWQSGTNIDISFLYASRTGTLVLTVQYTKTASQSRSVESLSKGGESEVVDKVDKVDEEKKVDEPLDKTVDEPKEELTKEPVEQPSEPISEPSETKTDNLSKEETELKEEDESKEIEDVTEEPEVTEEEPEEEPVDPEPSKEEADER